LNRSRAYAGNLPGPKFRERTRRAFGSFFALARCRLLIPKNQDRGRMIERARELRERWSRRARRPAR
jgi:hypothetical protein